jgi:hypothetical protein
MHTMAAGSRYKGGYKNYNKKIFNPTKILSIGVLYGTLNFQNFEIAKLGNFIKNQSQNAKYIEYFLQNVSLRILVLKKIHLTFCFIW